MASRKDQANDFLSFGFEKEDIKSKDQENKESTGDLSLRENGSSFIDIRDKILNFSIKNVDISNEFVDIPLTLPFKFNDKYVLYVRLKRLYIKDLSVLKKSLSRFSDMGEGRNLFLVYKFFEILLSHSLECFIDSDGNPLDKNLNNRLVGKIPINNIIKLLLSIFLLNRESPYISTNYECEKCKTLNMFDINPDNPNKEYPEGELHSFMENLFDVVKEDYDIFDDKFTLNGLKISLKRPFTLIQGDKEIQVTDLFIKYPSLEEYNSVFSNPRKKEEAELWILFDNIIGINDYNETETNYIKKVIGILNFYNKFHPSDFKQINDELFRDGIDLNHSFSCMNCGHINNVGLDLSNFFGFLLE
jgi:hypothetical protein